MGSGYLRPGEDPELPFFWLSVPGCSPTVTQWQAQLGNHTVSGKGRASVPVSQDTLEPHHLEPPRSLSMLAVVEAAARHWAQPHPYPEHCSKLAWTTVGRAVCTAVLLNAKLLTDLW